MSKMRFRVEYRRNARANNMLEEDGAVIFMVAYVDARDEADAINIIRRGSYMDSESEYIVRSHTYYLCGHCSSHYVAEELVKDWGHEDAYYEYICLYCKEDLESNKEEECET